MPHSRKLLVLLCALLALAGPEIVRLRAIIDAKPLVEMTKVDARTEDVRRGPVKISRTTITAPDGTKTTTSVREIKSEKRHSEVRIEEARKETPIAVRRPRRWGYLDFDPRAGFVPVGARLGMDVIGDFGAGAWYYRPGNAFGVTVGGRF